MTRSPLPASTAGSSDDSDARVPRAVVRWVSRPRGAHRPLPLAEGRRLLVAVAGPRGEATCRALADLGLPVDSVRVEAGSVTCPDHVGGLVDLTALDAPSGNDEAAVREATAATKTALFVVQACQRALLRAAKSGGALLMTVGEHAPSDAATAISAARSGLLKTAALEWPDVAACHVRLPALAQLAPDTIAMLLAAELRRGFLDVEVCLHGETREVPEVVASPVNANPQRAVKANAFFVASGGARGVTATTLLALAKSTSPRLLLLGRTELVPEPAGCAQATTETQLKAWLVAKARERGEAVSLPHIAKLAGTILAVREVNAFVRTLTATGAAVKYAAVDVRNRADVTAAIDACRAEFGEVTGLVHGAGVLADKRIEDKTQEQVDRVMDTKVFGLDALLFATANDPLEHVLLFSSVAGRYGNVGQVDYAMANEALTAMAHVVRQQRPHCSVKSLMWGPWEGGMVTPALKKTFAERGVMVLSHEDGARHFVDEMLRADPTDIDVVFGGELSAPTRDVAHTVHLDAKSYPIGKDHALDDVPVFPAVCAAELMARAAGTTALQHLRVNRGMRLLAWQGAGHDVETRVNDDVVSLWLQGPEKHAPNYSAHRAATNAAPSTAPALPTLPAYAFAPRSTYGALLFHGAAFEAVASLPALSTDGASATLRGAHALKWPALFDGEPVFDAAALDGALQLVLLWGRHVTGGAYLPTSIGRIETWQRPIVDGVYTARLFRKTTPGLSATADVWLLAPGGAVHTVLSDITVHRLPDDHAFASKATSTLPRLAG